MSTVGDDHFFEQFGDMLTPDELRRLNLHSRKNRRRQSDWLREYAQRGVAEHQDPGAFTLNVALGADGTAVIGEPQPVFIEDDAAADADEAKS